MSDSGPSSRTSTRFTSRRTSVFRNSSESNKSRDSTIDDEQPGSLRPTPRSTLTRHFTTLREHADALRANAPGGGNSSSPIAKERREGFAWETPNSNDARGVQEMHEPSAHPTKGSMYDARGEIVRSENGSVADHETVKRGTWPNSQTSSPNIETGVKRLNTYSSLDSVDKTARRHAPDLRMFGAPNGDLVDNAQPGPQSHAPKLTKAGRILSIMTPPTRQKITSDERSPKRVHMADGQPKRSDAFKVGLKDRRNLDQIESMKLTLPLAMPEIPSRSRPPISDGIVLANLRGMAAPRPRSPKTPWAVDSPATWLVTEHPTATSTVVEDPLESVADITGRDLLFGNYPIESSVTPINERPDKTLQQPRSRPRFGRGRSHKSEKSESSLAKTPDGSNSPAVDDARTEEELKQLGKRSRRWRWSGPWTSGEVDSPINASSRNPSFRSRIWNPLKRRVSQSPTPISPPITPPDFNAPLIFRRKPSTSRPVQTLAALPTPPIFVPPGVVRVPTPPMFDEHGEVKEGLSNFFFDMQDTKRAKPSPGSIWDSDAILMPQASNITPPTSSSEESPQGVSSQPSPLPQELPPTPVTPGYMHPWSRSSANSNPDGKSGGAKKSKEVREAEEMAKFEWLIPEHYPNSPLCPLHQKYRGASKGFCYYHRGLRGAFEPGESVATPTSEKLEIPSARKRRLVSLSSP
ncbi:hypothetical protein BDV96DRAFT_125747 [Lophiotrema nucula]|uniref:Uncharacterized protein n=1 Tax=Lophiotrema nucula TaxID=690887 RepID=A0A6A5Z1Y9_9PLEO|nr:hypothetical protein BDV96DRAFT_125747 [Lophiotrema nucula]